MLPSRPLCLDSTDSTSWGLSTEKHSLSPPMFLFTTRFICNCQNHLALVLANTVNLLIPITGTTGNRTWLQVPGSHEPGAQVAACLPPAITLSHSPLSLCSALPPSLGSCSGYRMQTLHCISLCLGLQIARSM